ncbi:hypothetical protein AYM40_32080 [Paraburkholderia phytofirmans OLGA172]|uniref:Uncharacterized protein n=1 Tax=Paraburkholderia phytofirmans OLGA172 TaxID=1417228 RepID=A0A160FU88_9BURK|nr:hypothetical protein AYM40_32080 [Paraburkholderia phytofirmans OLGA172]
MAAGISAKFILAPMRSRWIEARNEPQGVLGRCSCIAAIAPSDPTLQRRGRSLPRLPVWLPMPPARRWPIRGW